MCYLAVAVLGLWGVHSRRLVVFLGLLVCLGLYAGQIYFHLKTYGSRFSWLYCCPEYWPRLMSDFLAGVVFYGYRDRIVLSWPILFSCGWIAHIRCRDAISASPPTRGADLGGCMLFFMAYLPNGRLHHFASRGDLSYGFGTSMRFPSSYCWFGRFVPWLHPAEPLHALRTGVTARLVCGLELAIRRESIPQSQEAIPAT